MPLHIFSKTEKIKAQKLNENFEGLADGTLLEDIPASSISPTTSFNAYAGSGTSMSNAAFTKILFNTERMDRGGDYDTATSRFTAAHTADHFVGAVVGVSTSNNTSRIIISIYINGVSTYRGSDYTTASKDGSAIFAANIPLVEGDYVEVYAYQNTGASRNCATGPVTYYTGFLHSKP